LIIGQYYTIKIDRSGQARSITRQINLGKPLAACEAKDRAASA
jgi:hypothetical protein